MKYRSSICHALMIKESGFILLSNDTLSLSNIWHPKLILWLLFYYLKILLVLDVQSTRKFSKKAKLWHYPNRDKQDYFSPVCNASLPLHTYWVGLVSSTAFLGNTKKNLSFFFLGIMEEFRDGKYKRLMEWAHFAKK